MFKRLTAGIFLLAVVCGTSWGLTEEYTPFRLNSWYVNSSDEAAVYSRYPDVFYQLRDITRSSSALQAGGPQWFATVYENYRYSRNFYGDTATNDRTTNVGTYRRTMGGGIPDIPLSVIGDIVDGFNFVFAEEPQPYDAWSVLWANGSYDIYPDPLESLCIVTVNGQARLNVKLGNPYARHFPFWWDWTANVTSNTIGWWRNNYNWRNASYATVEPIAYIYSPSDNGIYTRGSTGLYSKAYDFVSSADLSGDVTLRTHYYVKDLSGSTILTLSGDLASVSGDVHYYLNSADQVAYKISGDRVYDAGGTLKYTIEANGTDRFICEIRNIGESVTFGGDKLQGYYTVGVVPSTERQISSGSYLDATITINSAGTQTYGSRPGWITFRQSASFMRGYRNYLEATTIPVVIANVANGDASTVPLIFDMVISAPDGSMVDRVKFTWDVQSNKTQDIGRFFIIQSGDAMPVYNVETRITNRTGTIYRLYRYDMAGILPNTTDFRSNYRNILPDYWKYDLTADNYGTLPDHFLLDAQSQIAPGLVTVYGTRGSNNASTGYTTLNMQNDTSASFRLYDYTYSNPRDLTLNYVRIRNMTEIAEAESITSSDGIVSVRKFRMDFVDVASNDANTARELRTLMGKPPVMVTSLSSTMSAASVSSSGQGISASSIRTRNNLGNSVSAAFELTEKVPDGLVSFDVISDDSDTVSEDTTTQTTPTPNSTPASGDASPTTDTTGSSSFSASATRVSRDIPILPVNIRMRIPKDRQLISAHWEDFENTQSSSALLNEFRKYGTIWVRSEATEERDADLLEAINDKGRDLGVSAADCVRAFVYNNELYLDFIAVLADGSSSKTGKSAYVGIFKDDNVPYLLIGDGAEDGVWDMTFFVDSINRETTHTTVSADNSTTTNQNSSNNGGSSGGGCNSVSAMAVAIILLGVMRLSTRKS